MTLRFSFFGGQPGDLTDSLVHFVLCDSVTIQKGFRIYVFQYPDCRLFLGDFQYDIQYQGMGQRSDPVSHRSSLNRCQDDAKGKYLARHEHQQSSKGRVSESEQY